MSIVLLFSCGGSGQSGSSAPGLKFGCRSQRYNTDMIISLILTLICLQSSIVLQQDVKMH